jgi:K+/H+ antiporter YhaU regulatory subunit KhtT
MKKQLSLEQEALVLAYLEYHRGRQMKGDARQIVYDIYRIFQQDRDKDVCSCLDRDTFRKVDGFINSIEWSEETRSSEKMKQLLPNLYLEPIQIEEESTQPVQVDMAKLEKAIKRRKRTTKKEL